MTRTLAAAVAVILLAPAAHGDLSLHSYAFSKHYIVTVSRKAVEDSPAWKDDAENPPLSARKAIKLANEMKDSLVKDSKDFKWVLESASLRPFDGDKWYWVVRYEALFQGGSTGGTPPEALRLVVLMDGKVVQPEVRDHR